MVAGWKSTMASTTRRCDGWSLSWRGYRMFGLGGGTRIYLAPGEKDMRKGFDGLYGLVRDQLLCDPLSGHVFLFSNAQRNRLKIIFVFFSSRRRHTRLQGDWSSDVCSSD